MPNPRLLVGDLQLRAKLAAPNPIDAFQKGFFNRYDRTQDVHDRQKQIAVQEGYLNAQKDQQKLLELDRKHRRELEQEQEKRAKAAEKRAGETHKTDQERFHENALTEALNRRLMAQNLRERREGSFERGQNRDFARELGEYQNRGFLGRLADKAGVGRGRPVPRSAADFALQRGDPEAEQRRSLERIMTQEVMQATLAAQNKAMDLAARGGVPKLLAEMAFKSVFEQKAMMSLRTGNPMVWTQEDFKQIGQIAQGMLDNVPGLQSHLTGGAPGAPRLPRTPPPPPDGSRLEQMIRQGQALMKRLGGGR